jgi:hypothetical protein
MRISEPRHGAGWRIGILRLRGRLRKANSSALLKMTLPSNPVLCFALVPIFLTSAWATTYFVSSSTGNDGNSGTSTSTAWKTIAHVNAQTFQPGDSILFKRGDVWNESLIPPSSGSPGNAIAFDAYGTGPAPNLTGYYAVPTSAWVPVSGNAWKAPLPATYSTINFCLFGSIWGQKVSAVSSNLTAKWDFYFANGYVYVYSVGTPAIFYNEPIVPMAASNVPLISINGQSWLTFQHFLLNWFDQYGAYVEGTSDHLVFANMEADSMIPQGTQPLGFYVNESAPGPGDIKIYNAEAHLNYDGFRFDGVATAISMVNDKGYANRDGALVDNTGAVTYSYCHFYASSLAVAGSTDVEWTSGSGPTAGAGNVAADTPPAVQVWQRYPAEITLTVDDAGMTPGADAYYAGTVLPVADAAGVPVGAAITVGYPLANTLISEFQGWINAGRDVTSHSISHTYYTNTDALDIQYTGSGSAASLSISGKTLTITVTGASDSVSYNLAQGQPQGTMLGLAEALAATGKYTYSFLTPCQGPYGTGCSAYTAAALLAQDLADVSGQDVKPSIYHMQLDVTRLTTDEITLSRQWMTANLTGLPSTPVYVYPGGYETTTMQGIAEGVPYVGARGALKEDLGVKDTYADGFNVQNVTSFGVNPSWMGIAPASLNQKIEALVWKEQVWGVPWGIFWHLNELTQTDPVGGTEITDLIQDFKNAGATIQTNTGLVNWLLAGTQETGTDGNAYYKIAAANSFPAGGGLDFRPTQNSPVVDAGQNLGTAYAIDINGVNQNNYGTGWEIGAHAYVGYAVYGEGDAAAYFKLGENTAGDCGAPFYSCALTSNAAVDVLAAPSLGSVVSNDALVTDAMISNVQMFRVTDGTTQSGANANFTYNICCGGSADDNVVSHIDHFFEIQDTGGNTYLRYLNPSGNDSLALYPNLDPAKGNLVVNSGEFSYTDDLLFYDYGSTSSPVITQYNLSGYNSPSITNPSALPTQTAIANYADAGITGVQWMAAGGIDRNDDVNSLSFHLAAGFSTTGGQNSGCLVAEAIANAQAPVLTADLYYVYNTCTGVVSEWSYSGSWVQTTVGTVAMADRYCVHNVKYHGGNYMTITANNGSCSPGNIVTGTGSTYYFWKMGTATVIPCVACAGHETEYVGSFIGTVDADGDGENYPEFAYATAGAGLVNTSGTEMTFVSGIAPSSSMIGKIAINNVGYTIASCTSSGCTLTTSAGTQSGVYYNWPVSPVQGGGFVGAPVLIDYPALWDLPTCTGGSFPYTNQPCLSSPLDSHLNSSDNPGSDTGMVFISTTSVGNTSFPRATGVVSTSGSTVSLLYGAQFSASWVGHNLVLNGGNYLVTAYTSATSITVSPAPGTLTAVSYWFETYPGGGYDELDGVVGGGTAPAPGYNYRFAYIYNTTLNATFATYEGITACSQTGNYCLVSTDWQCSLGTTNGTNTSACAPAWPTSTPVASGAKVWPRTGNAGLYVYQVGSGCTTGGAQPTAWNQIVGGTQADGGCTWSNIGTYRGDVVAVAMNSQAAQPIQGVAMVSPPLTTSNFSSFYTLVSSLSGNANLKAVAPEIPWNAVESNTAPGSYNWTTVDSQLLQLIASGQRLRLIVVLSTEGGVNTGTPSYVFGSSWASNVGAGNPQDMVVCSNFEGDSESPYGHAGFTNGGVWNSSNATYGSDLSGQPVSYEPPFMIAAQKFITQVVQHFSPECATYSSDCANAAMLGTKMDYVRFGLTGGGEEHPLCTPYWPLLNGYTTFQGEYLDGSNSGGQAGYIDQMTTYIENAVTTYRPTWKLIFDTSDVAGYGHTFADHEGQIAASAGYGFGTNGLQIADLTNCPGANCESDWYSNFGMYAAVPHYLQTLTASCPDNSCLTGNLVSLLDFTMAHGTDAFELYACDVLLALEPSVYPGSGPAACNPVFSTSLYGESYAAAVSEANSGP